MLQTLDVSGLPESVIHDLRNLVATLKGNTLAKESRKLTPEEWIKEHTAWVNSHPPVTTFVDDSRESIYAGRGE
jgi:hypothetical protein